LASVSANRIITENSEVITDKLENEMCRLSFQGRVSRVCCLKVGWWCVGILGYDEWKIWMVGSVENKDDETLRYSGEVEK
jgi:hypothetical protein